MFKGNMLQNLFSICCLIGLQCSQAAQLRLYRSSLTDYKTTELKRPLPLLQWIDLSKITFIFAFGFMGTPEQQDMITSAFIERNDTNFILLNWEEEAQSEQLESVLAHALVATPNSIRLGIQLGISLLALSRYIDMSNVHLAGHSLGAHLVGYAGSLLRGRGIIVGWITGLDPSSYKYEGFIHSAGLDSSSAAFVDIWHSNPGDYGTNQSLGTVDVWFNCDRNVQPGCKEGEFPPFTTDALCSHVRSKYLYAESVLQPKSFVACRSTNCNTWVIESAQKPCDDILYVNANMDTSARGNYYLSTNSKQPYGKGIEGLRSC